MQEDFLSIKEFAGYIGVHPNTIRRAIKNGRLQAFRIGGADRSHYRIPKSEVNRVSFLDLEDIIRKSFKNVLKDGII